MNKTELITFLRKPNQLSSEQLKELEGIVNENPYFLSARVLLAKASKEQGHPKTKKRIASAAIYSTDRILLKKYMSGNLFFLNEPPEAEEKQPQSGKTGEKETEKPERTARRSGALIERKDRESPEIPEFPSGDLDAVLEELQHDLENLKTSREKFAEIQQKIEEEDAVSAALNKASGKEDTKLESTRSPQKPNDFKTEESNVKDTATEEIEKPAPEITVQALQAAKKAREEVVREDEAKEAEENKKDKPKDEFDEGSRAERVIHQPRVSTRNYPKSPENTDPEKFPVEEKPKKEESSSNEKEIEDNLSKKELTTKKKVSSKTVEKKKTSETKSDTTKKEKKDRKSSRDIINKFIKELPTIKYQRKEDMIAEEDLAEQSAVWDSNLASEYLADIYLHQGNKKRAIEIYEALSLKYPEKKSYFADLISKIE